MAAAPDDSDNELNFSDNDSDTNENTPARQMIAHKEMKVIETNDTPNDTPNDSPDDFEAISPPESPTNNKEVSNPDTNNEAQNILPDKETINDNDQNFELISPDTKENVVDEAIKDIENIDEGNIEDFTSETKQSYVENIENRDENTETEKLTQIDDSNNILDTSSDFETNIDGNKPQTLNVASSELNEVEAPVPSPLSDTADDDNTETSKMISDVLNDDNDGSQSPDFDVNLDINEEVVTKKTETIEEPESHVESETTKIEDKETAMAEGNTQATNVDENLAEGQGQKDKDSLDISIGSEKEENLDISVNSDKEENFDASIDVGKEENSEANVDVEESEEGTSVVNQSQESEDPMEDQDDLIADIFGESDEEEEFEGFLDEELPPDRTIKHTDEPSTEQARDSSDDEETLPSRDFVSDFDLMLQKRKEMNRMKRRAKKDFDIINDNDDIIAAMIRQMKDAAEEDRMLNQAGKAATKKLKMLPSVLNHLRKADLQSAFIDCGILPAIKEWLTPLPDHALPHINIRKSFLRILGEFPPLDKGALKISGIGRAVMLLFKHPKETTENKRVAGKIISNWARPIFNVSTNFNELTREERENRDKQNIPEAKRRRLSSGDMSNRQTLNDDDDVGTPRKPGDKGWIGRARVPMPSHRDYVNRPVPKIESYDFAKSGKQSLSRYEKHARRMRDKKTLNSASRKAVGISLNGSKMAL